MSSPPATPKTRINRLYRAFHKELDAFDAFPEDMSPSTKRKHHQFLDSLRENMSRTGAVISKKVAPTIEPEPQEEDRQVKSPVLVLWDLITPNARHLTASDFCRTLLSFPYTGSLANNQVLAFNRVIAGYHDSKRNWYIHLTTLVVSRNTWDVVCTRARAIDDIPEDVDRLAALNAFCFDQENICATESFIDYVVRTVQHLKYILIWVEHDDCGQAGREWKSDIIIQLFSRKHPNHLYQGIVTKAGEKALTAFRRKHEKQIAAQRSLLAIYRKFGINIFYDRFWGIGERRSGTFQELSDLVLEECPTQNQPPASLYTILTVLGGSDEIAHLVRDFVAK